MDCLLRVTIATVAVTFGIAGCSHFHGHGSHSDGHSADRSALVLDEGKKWQTDAPLRSGIKRIKVISESLQRTDSTAQITPAKRLAAADGVQDQVAYLVANCKLEPKADAALHVLISDMLQGADKLRKPESATDGASAIHTAVLQYPAFFDDPDW